MTLDLDDGVTGFAGPPAPNRSHEREARVRAVHRARVRRPIHARGPGRRRNPSAESAPPLGAPGPTAA